MKMPSYLLFGGDYSPDQWTPEVIDRDIQTFKEANINIVTLPVFSWAKLEPSEGVYNFEWLDQVMDKLRDAGIGVSLATPTTAQPAWLSTQYPEVLPVDIAGRKRTHGMRVFFCYNSPKYRERAAAIAKEMAQRYGDYENLVNWHVANEYGTHCYCDICEAKFRVWLEERYGSIEELNLRWHTSFWGRIVYSFEEVRLPTELNDDYRFNPVIWLDYKRFVTDSTLECYLNEADVIREYSPDIPVFSNISGYIKNLNQHKLNDHMDKVAWDNYPTPFQEYSLPALKHDIMRGLKDGQSFWVVEQTPNQQNWQPYNKLKKPGEIRKIAYQGLAHGSDSSMYFQMRQSIAGQEKFHGAVISHADTTETRVFREIKAMGREFKTLGDRFVGGGVQSKVAMLFDWDNWWALEGSSGPTKDMDYLEQVHHYYKGFFHNNIPVDVVRLSVDFSGYDIIVAPLLYMMKEGIAEKLIEFVEQGGTLVTTYMTGLVDENDRCVFGPYPGKLRELLGIWIEEIDALLPEEQNSIEMLADTKPVGMENSYRSNFLCDVIHLEGAKALAVHGSDFYAGQPCLTVQEYGKGKAYHIGSNPEEKFVVDFFGTLAWQHGLTPYFAGDKGVEVGAREGEQGKTYFVINHNQHIANVDLKDKSYTCLLTDKKYSGAVALEAYDVLVLSED